MTRLVTAGCEIYATTSISTTDQCADGSPQNGNVTRDTTTKRSGAAAWRCRNTSSTASTSVVFPIGTGALDRGYWIRIYLWVTTAPSSAVKLIVTSAGTLSCNLDTSGRVYASPDSGTTSAALNDSAWHRVEFYVKPSATQANVAYEVRVDGVTIKSGTNVAGASSAPTTVTIGLDTGVGVTGDIYFDDLAINDDQGSSQNSWPGQGYVILLLPSSDNSRGSWTGGGGGTTSLFDALNNTPPVGAIAPGSNTSQISANAVATTGKFDTTSYTTAGASSSDQAVLCHVIACHGEQVATGTKSGSASTDTAVNNTPSSSTGAINYGNDVGAEGNFPSNWRWARGAQADYSTQPTLSSGARLNIVTTTSSRVADCCFLGLYVEMRAPSTFTKAGYAKENG